MKKKPRGMLLVEALIGLGVISVVLLILVTFFGKSFGSLTNTRLKKEVSGYAQGELKHWKALAKLGQPGVPPIPVGYNTIDPAQAPFDGVAQVLWYPNELTGGMVTSFNKQRIRLKRTLTVTTQNQNQADEYKLVKVELEDAAIGNPAFSKVTQETTIRKPHPNSLDLRQDIAGFGTLTMRMLDEDGSVILDNCLPGVEIIGQAYQSEIPLSELNTPPGGATTPSIPVGTYQTNFNAEKGGNCTPGYWPQVKSLAVGQGPNAPADINPVNVQAVRYAAAKFKVVDALDAPVEGAMLSAAVPPPGLPQIPAYSGGSNWSQATDASGFVTKTGLPISVKGQFNDSSWFVTSITKSGYFTLMPNFNFTINSTLPVPPLLQTFVIHPIKYGTLNVHVQASGVAKEKAYVMATDNGDENPLCPSNPSNCAVLASGHTNANGDVQLSVPVNWLANPGVTQRTIRLVTARVEYKRDVVEVAVQENATIPKTVDLQPATLTLVLDPVTTPQTPHHVSNGSGFRPTAWAIYDGHDGPINISYETPSGAINPTKTWNWQSTPGSIGYVNPSVNSFHQTSFVATAEGSGQIDVVVNAGFSYAGGQYGPPTGPLNYTSDPGVFYVTVDEAAPPNLFVQISGPTLVPPEATNVAYHAVTSYGTNPLPPDITWHWTIIGSGSQQGELPAEPAGGIISPAPGMTITPLGGTVTPPAESGGSGGGVNATLNPPTNAKDVTLNVTGPEGATFQLKVRAHSAMISQSAEHILTITIGYNPMTITLPCEGANGPVELAPNTNYQITSNVQGGSNNYSYSWTLIDPGPPPVNSGTAHPTGNLTGSTTEPSVNYQALLPGTVWAQLTATDNLFPSLNATEYCVVQVNPPGGSH